VVETSRILSMSWLYDLCLYSLWVLYHYQSGNLCLQESNQLGSRQSTRLVWRADPFVFAQTFLTTALAWGLQVLVQSSGLEVGGNRSWAVPSAERWWFSAVHCLSDHWAKLTLRGSSKIPVKTVSRTVLCLLALREIADNQKRQHTGKMPKRLVVAPDWATICLR